ncbi:hypothetical protein O3P69_007225 [Scylla paramamosain]
MASAPPFVMVVARQMGVPLGVQGVVSAVITAAAVVVRPFIAALADTFPARRKIIFLALISIMIAAYNPIGFLPPLQPSPHLSGQLISSSFLAIDLNSNNSYTNLHLLTPRQQQQSLGECVVTDAWDCFAFCQNHEPCPMLTYHSSGFKFSLQPSHNGLGTEQMENITTSFPMTTNESLKIRHLQEVTPGPNVLKEWQSSTDHTWEKGKGKDMADGTWNLKENQTMVYIIEGVDGWSSKMGFNVRLQEDIAERMGTSGQHVNMVQGLTLLVQALSAIPCMFLCDWFMRRFGAQKVISTVLFLYSLRLLGLAAASHLGVLWVTALVEMINGPCFGLGYTAIVVHASSLAPRGYSTTVQSVVGVCYGTLGYAGASFVGGVMYEVMGGEWLYLVTGAAAFFTWTLHLSYITVCPPVTKTEEVEPAETRRKIDPEDPHAMVRLDNASLQLDRKGESAGGEMLAKEEEEVETLLEIKEPPKPVTEVEKERRVKGN